jgi:6-phosphogluconolactonase
VIDPDGEYLLAANQDTDSVVTFRLDAASGALTATGYSAHVPTPVCVQVM